MPPFRARNELNAMLARDSLLPMRLSTCRRLLLCVAAVRCVDGEERGVVVEDLSVNSETLLVWPASVAAVARIGIVGSTGGRDGNVMRGYSTFFTMYHEAKVSKEYHAIMPCVRGDLPVQPIPGEAVTPDPPGSCPVYYEDYDYSPYQEIDEIVPEIFRLELDVLDERVSSWGSRASSFASRNRRLFLGVGEDSLVSLAAMAGGNETLLVSPIMQVGSYDAGPTLFTTIPHPSRAFGTAFEALRRVGAQRYSLVIADTESNQRHCDVSAHAAAAGLSLHVSKTLVTDGLTESQARDFVETLSSELGREGTDALFVCVSEPYFTLIYEAMHVLHLKVKALFCRGCDSRAEPYDGGILAVTPLAPSFDIESSYFKWSFDNFSERYYKAYKEHPDEVATAAFASLEALVHAIRKARSLDPARLASVLQSMNIMTIHGRLTFDPNTRYLDRDMFVIQTKQDETPVIVAPLADSDADFMYPIASWALIRCYSSTKNLDIWAINETGDCTLCPHKTASTYDFLKKHRVCISPPEGYYVSNASTGGDVEFVPCPVGTMFAEDEHHFSEHDSATSEEHCLRCPPGTFQAEEGQKFCNLCELGTTTALSGSTECFRCHPKHFQGYIHVAAQFGTHGCSSCPPRSFCNLTDNLYASISNEAGFAVVAMDDGGLSTYRAVSCFHGNGDACRPGGTCYVSSETGEVSMEGPLCGACREGYSRRRNLDVCEPCRSLRYNLVSFFLEDVLFLYFVVLAYAVTLARTDVSSRRSVKPVVVKLILTYLNIISALWILVPPTSWGYNFMVAFFELMPFIAFRNASFSRLDCNLMQAFPNITRQQIHIVYGILELPVFASFTAFLFALLRAGQKYRGYKVLGWKHNHLILVVYIYLRQPVLVAHLASSLQTVFYETGRLASDTRVVASPGSQGSWYYIGMTALAFYAVLVPYTVRCIMWYYQRREAHGETPWAYRLFRIGYKPKSVRYEGIAMMRKAVLHIIPVFPGAHAVSVSTYWKAESTMFAGAMFLFLVVHYNRKPYDSRNCFVLHQIELACLVSGFYSVLFGQIPDIASTGFGMWKARDALGVMVTVLILVLNLRFCYLSIRACLPRFPICGKALASAQPRVQVHATGLLLKDIDSHLSVLLFEEMCALVIEMHISNGALISYEGLTVVMKRIIVHAGYLRAIQTHHESSLGEFIQAVEQFVSDLPLPDDTKGFVLGKLEGWRDSWIRWTRRLSTNKSTESSSRPHHSQRNLRQNYDHDEAELFSRFTAEAFEHSIDREYYLDELYLTMLALGEDMCDLPAPPAVSRTGNTEKGMTTGQLDETKVFSSELRAELIENRRLRDALASTNRRANALSADSTSLYPVDDEDLRQELSRKSDELTELERDSPRSAASSLSPRRPKGGLRDAKTPTSPSKSPRTVIWSADASSSDPVADTSRHSRAASDAEITVAIMGDSVESRCSPPPIRIDASPESSGELRHFDSGNRDEQTKDAEVPTIDITKALEHAAAAMTSEAVALVPCDDETKRVFDDNCVPVSVFGRKTTSAVVDPGYNSTALSLALAPASRLAEFEKKDRGAKKQAVPSSSGSGVGHGGGHGGNIYGSPSEAVPSSSGSGVGHGGGHGGNIYGSPSEAVPSSSGSGIEHGGGEGVSIHGSPSEAVLSSSGGGGVHGGEQDGSIHGSPSEAVLSSSGGGGVHGGGPGGTIYGSPSEADPSSSGGGVGHGGEQGGSMHGSLSEAADDDLWRMVGDELAVARAKRGVEVLEVKDDEVVPISV
eukprot:TRINITY_DN1395_c0_g1_i3.p1 TRINITY_DN1395_c0_g1~~TRINITY_DN1395_c0_g1_i3.p1  ORF type:complete len:1760 (-),score=277.65 TRINITY_DN1395_c0_g1_i3:117-5396(-)